MPYTLTLTASERKAIDWVGYRYWWGNNLYCALWSESELVNGADAEGWDDDTAFTFRVPEHVAWSIRDNLEAEDSWMPCACKEMADKLRSFCDRIV